MVLVRPNRELLHGSTRRRDDPKKTSSADPPSARSTPPASIGDNGRQAGAIR